MTAQGEDILAWLETAISERETAARAASEGPWEETGIGDYGWTVSAPTGALFETDDTDQGRADTHYIALNDPESVLRRCAADRKLLGLHGGRAHECSVFDRQGDVDNCAWIPESDVCSTIHLVAEGYGWTEGER
ncbi:DUF6221 family protein [Streptomyces ardesiacus]|uniref:DUF6221 family protein n=1 Tax=Streptomyces ardesiacus TaxID=285564 RepID=UPI003F49FC73